MTTFRLSAGRPAASPLRRAVRVPTPKEAVDTPLTPWFPNREADTPLACGDLIPWPVIRAFGNHIHGQIWCDVHGWQPKITKADIERARKAEREWQATSHTQSFTQDIPF